MAMYYIDTHIRGIAPLLMHNNQLADPLNPYKKLMIPLTSKRKPTDSDVIEIMRIEFTAALYYTRETGVYIPGDNLYAVIRDCAALSRRKKDIERGVWIEPEKVPFVYSGPRTPEELFESNEPSFRDVRPAITNSGGTVMRCRPVFQEWKLTFTIKYDETATSESALRGYLDKAGSIIGLGDYRPRFGTFEVTTWNPR